MVYQKETKLFSSASIEEMIVDEENAGGQFKDLKLKDLKLGTTARIME
jgi:hypothetical protein